MTGKWKVHTRLHQSPWPCISLSWSQHHISKYQIAFVLIVVSSKQIFPHCIPTACAVNGATRAPTPKLAVAISA